MNKMEIVKTFRCSEKEAAYIKKKSSEMGISESEYMRSKIFSDSRIRLPPEIKANLEQLNYLNLKIGNNINQVVRSCNTKKFITKLDYQMLREDMINLQGQYGKIIELLREYVKNGSDKT